MCWCIVEVVVLEKERIVHKHHNFALGNVSSRELFVSITLSRKT